jgi:hypothetical protein
MDQPQTQDTLFTKRPRLEISMRQYAVNIANSTVARRMKLQAVLKAKGEPIYPRTLLTSKALEHNLYYLFDGEDWCLSTIDDDQPTLTIDQFITKFHLKLRRKSK